MALAFTALLVALGGTALAATGNLVSIADPSNPSHVAKVDSTGHLNVGDGSGNLTVDGTVTAREANPSTWWRSTGFSATNCVNLYSPPPGKAAIVKTIVTTVFPQAPVGSTTAARYYIGNGCNHAPDFSVNPDRRSLQMITTPIEPGLIVPGDSGLYMDTISAQAQSYVFGYTVAATAVKPTTTAPVATQPTH